MKAQLIKQLTELLTEPSAMEVVTANRLLLEATDGHSIGVNAFCRKMIVQAEHMGIDAGQYYDFPERILRHKLTKQEAERIALDIVTEYGGFIDGKNQLSAG